MEPSSDSQRTKALAKSNEPDAPSTVGVTGSPVLLSSTLPLGVSGQRPVALPEIPGYKVLGEIARGGMGRVLAVRDETLDREVAIKVLLPGSQATRFIFESKITARLPHPGIPPAHALGALADGSPFLVMKLIRGRTLADELAGRRGTQDELPRFVRVLEQVAEAVGFAHSQGILHRDLKPANVMVGAFGEVQVMDWGLAKVRGETDVAEQSGGLQSLETHATMAGAIVGTPRYMAPEQARGEALDARADVFALGAILAQILTNKAVYQGRSAREVVEQAAAGDLAAAFARLDACGADSSLVSLARRCLNPEPAERPTDGAEVAAQVAAYRATVEERLRAAEVEAASAAVRSAEVQKRARLRLALAGLALVLVALIGFGAWYAQRQEIARKERESKREQQEMTQRSERAAARARAEQTVGTALAQLFDLERRALWKEAERTLDQAGAAVGKETENSDLQSQIAAARRDLALVARLDELILLRTIVISAPADRGSAFFGYVRGMSDDSESANRAIAAALREHGINVQGEPADTVIEKVRVSPVKEQIVAALDDWMYHERNLLVQGSLWKITTALGSESWRAKLPTHSLSAERSKKLLADTPVDQRSPSLYLFLDGVCEYWNADGLAELREGCRRYPGHFFLNYTLASAALRKYRASRERTYFDEALAACRAALAIRPESGSVWMIMASLYLEGNVVGFDAAAALDCSRRAVELLPDSARAHYWHGTALLRTGNSAGAVTSLRESIRLDPMQAASYESLAMALGKQHDSSGAEAAWREAIRLSPESPSLYFNLARELYEAGDYEGALPEFRESARRYSKDPLMLVRSAMHLETLGDKTAMQAALDAARKINLAQYQRLMDSQTQARRREFVEVLAGTRKCRVPGELSVLGRQAAAETRQYLTIAELCQTEFARHPEWELWPPDPPVFLAACCAAQAAAGQGVGKKLLVPEQSAWRAKALDWMEKYVGFCETALADEKQKAAARAGLEQCRTDEALVSLRGENLRFLPEEERPPWQALWAKVERLRAATE